jgi:hypothetical protein
VKRKPTRKESSGKEQPTTVEKALAIMRTQMAIRLLEQIESPGFVVALERLFGLISEPEQKRFIAEMQRLIEQQTQRQENGQILAEEGRAARKPKTETRAAAICRIYKRVRPSFPPGRVGNGATLEEVSRRFGSMPGRDKSITKQGIRKILKRCGVPCR